MAGTRFPLLYADKTGASFSGLDMDQHPMGVDVGYIDEYRLLKPETARMHGGQKDEVMKGFHITKDMIDFFQADLSGA